MIVGRGCVGDQTMDPRRTILPTTTHSRLMVGRMIPTRHTEDLCWAVAAATAWPGPAQVDLGQRVRDRSWQPHLEGVGAFTGTLATTLQRLMPYDPESKGIVERRVAYFKASFMPGRAFASPADFNAQFAA